VYAYLFDDVRLDSCQSTSKISTIEKCLNDTIKLTATKTGSSYLWKTNDTIQSISTNDTGWKWVQVNSNLCDLHTDSFYINNYQFTNPPEKIDTLICKGKFILLGNTGYAKTKYLWNTGDTIPQIVKSDSGLFVRQSRYNNRCLQIDSFFIHQQIPTLLNLPKDTSSCLDINVILNALNSQYNNYKWNSGDTTSKIKITQPGKYIVTATNGICTTTDSTNVKVNSLPSLHLPSDTVICFDDIEKVILDAGKPANGQAGFKSYFWYPTGETMETIGATVAQQYVVVVTDTNNCINKDTTLVEEKCGSKLYIPNAFTPNGDGINDVFYVHSRSLETFEIQIYDRWGEKVFSSTELTKGWDGTFQNSPCVNETYVWLIKYKVKGTNSTQSANGTVMLLR
ncbi:MAG: gliding motility-associated C-terminal domain-containing protein, partial [Bacteroidia bacterium]